MSPVEEPTALSVQARLLAAQHLLADGDLEAAVLEIHEAHADVANVDETERALCLRMVEQLLKVMGGVRDALGAERTALTTRRQVASAYADAAN